MKRLYLLRHAKAENQLPAQQDIERSLTDVGRNAASAIANYFLKHNYKPDIAICSPAARTRQTLEILAEKANLNCRCRFRFPQRLYLASPGTMISEISKVEDDFGSLLLVGHNTGLQELSMLLSENASTEFMHDMAVNYPTAALSIFNFPFDSWKMVEPYSGELVDFTYPKKLI